MEEGREEQTNQQTDGPTGRWTKGQRYEWMEGRIGRWMDGVHMHDICIAYIIFLQILILNSFLIVLTSEGLHSYLSVFLSDSLSVCLSVCLTACLPACLSVSLSVYLSIYLFIYLFIYLAIYIYSFHLHCIKQGMNAQTKTKRMQWDIGIPGSFGPDVW